MDEKVRWFLLGQLLIVLAAVITMVKLTVSAKLTKTHAICQFI
jgi:hypothetical protein